MPCVLRWTLTTEPYSPRVRGWRWEGEPSDRLWLRRKCKETKNAWGDPWQMLKELEEDDEATLDVLEEGLMLEAELRGKGRKDESELERLRQTAKRVTELREANYYGAEECEELRKEMRLLCGNRYVEYHGCVDVRLDGIRAMSEATRPEAVDERGETATAPLKRDKGTEGARRGMLEAYWGHIWDTERKDQKSVYKSTESAIEGQVGHIFLKHFNRKNYINKKYMKL